MKKTALLLLILLLLSSCTRDASVDDRLLEKANAIADETEYTKYVAPHYYGDCAVEESYAPSDIDNVTDAAFADGLYFTDVCTVQRYPHPDGGHGEGTAWMTLTVDLETGEGRPICPDPLCKHYKYDCDYIDMTYIGYYNGTPYFSKHDYDRDLEGNTVHHISILKLDIKTAETAALVTISSKPGQDVFASLVFPCIFDNKLYYFWRNEFTDTETRVEEAEQELCVIDLDSEKEIRRTSVPDSLSDGNIHISHVDGEALYCNDFVNGFYMTDMNFSYITKIGEEDSSIHFNSVDNETGEMFVLFDQKDYVGGKIGRVNGTEIEVITMPHENIVDFVATRDYIYYSVYDPVSVGEGIRGGSVKFEDGGKIYRTDRKSRKTSELIFEDGMGFNVRQGWTVIGDCLYFQNWQKNEEGGLISYGREVHAVRLNFVNKTAKYFTFG